MLRRQEWQVWSPSWPSFPVTGWDNWLRTSPFVEGRDCIVPEVPRVRHVAQAGSNQNAEEVLFFYRRFALASGAEPLRLTGLALEDYDAQLCDAVRTLPRLSIAEAARLVSRDRGPKDFVVLFERHIELHHLHTQLRLGEYGDARRAFHRGILHLPAIGLYLVSLDDTGWCLDGSGRWETALQRPADLTPVAGVRGETCDSACTRKGSPWQG